MLNTRKRRFGFVLATISAVAVTGAVVLFCGRRQLDLDIHTGRKRQESYIIGIKLKEKVLETDFSRFWKSLNGDYPKPKWRHLCDLPLLWNAPSENRYTGLLLWQMNLMAALESAKFSKQDKRKIVTTFSDLLETDPTKARHYSDDCLRFANEHTSERNTITNTPLWLLDSRTYLSHSEDKK